MKCQKKHIVHTKIKAGNQSKKRVGFIAGLLLVLLPKCPFCIMAYTSTVVLCGKDFVSESQNTHHSLLSIFLTGLLGLLILVGLLMNFRGKRTKYALALSILGIGIILNSVIRSGGQEFYYLGVSIVFMAVWMNGSLISILRKINNSFSGFRNTPESSPAP